MRSGCWSTPRRGLRRWTASSSSARRRSSRASCPSPSKASIRTTSARCSIRAASRCERAITARCGSWISSASRRRRALPSASTTRPPKSTRWSTPSATRSGCCADGPRRALPRRDRRTQPEPAQPRPASRRDSPCRGRQPAVRRPAEPRRRARGRRDPGPAVRGQRLRDLDRLGFAHERGGKGPHARGGDRDLRRRASHADRRAGRCRAPRQAGRARGGARFPGAGQVREPLLAHAERGARGRARRDHDGVNMRRSAQEPVVVNRDVRAVIVPAGVEVKLRPGTVGTITQALGGSYTIYVEGNLFRIAGVDGDAIGKETIEPPALPAGASDEDVNRVVWDQLRTCYDPEIPINIVDLGLVYDCRITPGADGTRDIAIKMTLTAPGCGMGEVLVADVRDKLKLVPTIGSVDVELVFDPPWNHSMMSEAARLQTGMM